MKRSQTFDDLTEITALEPTPKKSFLGEVKSKSPSFKIPKKSTAPAITTDGVDKKLSSPVQTNSKEDVQSSTDQTLPPAPVLIQTSDSLIVNTAAISAEADASTEDGKTSDNNAELARQHYNSLKQVSLDKRHESRIFNLRGFNNYVKSLVMNDFLRRIGPLGRSGATILDLGCGKGGDLRKWGIAKPGHLVCVDIADVSVQQCRGRYEERSDRELKFKANFIVADCTRDSLDAKFIAENIPDVEFDLVSCQFALHYGFESQAQAKQMLKNAISHLKPNCFFFGTIPNSNYLVKKYLSLKDGSRFGNNVFYVDFQKPNVTEFPLFGSKYVFYLDGAVQELPEFLIHFPLLKAMLEDEGMECVLSAPFTDYVYEARSDSSVKCLKDQTVLFKTRGLNESGTLNQEEWEVVACYMVFGFRKLTDGEVDQKRDYKRRKTSD